jgi:transmembrane sensor
MEERKIEGAFRASELIFKYLKGELSDPEQTELDSWIEESDANRALFSELTNPAHLNVALNELYQKDKKSAYRRLSRRLFPKKFNVLKLSPVIFRYVAAAVVLGLIATVIYVYTIQKPNKKGPQEYAGKEEVQDILPGGNHAVLTRSDGKHIVLDSIGVGTLLNDGDAKIIKSQDGQIVYQAAEKAPAEVGFNSVSTPASAQFQVILPDGSKVWLNALSRLDYPTAFTGNVRKVSLSGEGYFDVARDKSKPFHVNVDGMDVQVTGTEFNINAYKDEALVKSTLFEGGVKITRDEISFELSPGQQLQVDPRTKQVKVKDADLEAVSAWKNGVFYLNNVDIATLMRQAARWYDIEIEYPNGIPMVNLIGEIDRNTNLSELMKVLNETGIKTRLDGRTLSVF